MTLRQVLMTAIQSANARGVVKSAYRISTVLRTRTVVTEGVRIGPTVLSALSTQKIGRRLVLLVSGTVLPSQRVGRRLTTTINFQGPTVRRGVQLVQTKIDLLGSYGATSNADVDSGSQGGAWTNAANANGSPNGTLATSVGALTASQRHIGFTMPVITGKDSLTITKVEVVFYAKLQGVVGQIGNYINFYQGHGGSYLGQWLADADALTTGQVFDVTALYPTWASLSGARFSVLHKYAAASTAVTASLDAVILRVTATRTDAL